MRFRFVPAAFAGALLTGAFVAAEGCASFDEASGSPDATLETGLNDSLVVDVAEAGVEAASFCEIHRAAVFCTDFETPPVARGWTNALTDSDASTLSLLEGGSEASPEHSAGARIVGDPDAPPPDAAMGDAEPSRTVYAVLGKEVATLTAKRISVELDLRVDALPTLNPNALGSVCGLSDNALSTVQPSTYFTFRRDGSTPNGMLIVLGVDEGSGPTFQSRNIHPQLHTWFHVRLSVDRGEKAVALAVDGVDLLGKQPTELFANAKFLGLSAGLLAIADREDLSIAVDNVVVDVVEPP